MKKYLFLFSAILTVSGCFSSSPTFREREYERIYSAVNGKRFYIVGGKGYTCTVEGPFEVEVTDWNYIRLRDLETGAVLYSEDEPRIREFFFSQLKMEQTITSENQFRAALIPGGCRCVWHVADNMEHYDVVIEKSVLDKELPIVKKAFEKAKKTAEKKAREAAEKKAKKEAEKKHTAEQEATKKNNDVIKKYGKPYCKPFKAIKRKTGNEYIVTNSYLDYYYDFETERKKDCLFEETFHISQATSNGMLVYTKGRTCEYGYCYDKTTGGPYFVTGNANDREKVDGDKISGLFEYIGTFSYEAIFGAPRTVLKLKHVK